ncbi:MAG: four helix bundle protein [Bacteroidota bacterium]|nr:four helix bundle protein [Bacteroidota bacterium]
MHKYQDLKIWQKGIDLVVNVYQATSEFPKEEKFGLTSQMRRSAVSIPSNIAEGAGRNSDNDFVRFLSIANGSSYELETQVIVANRLKLLSNESCEAVCGQLNEIQKMNYIFQQRLTNKN